MKCFEITFLDQVAHVVMKRPEKRNSMIAEFWTELPELIADIDNNAKARAVVLSSTGPHFTSGIDTSLLGNLNNSEPNSEYEHNIQVQSIFYNQVKKLQLTFSALEACRMPVLAAVQGGCIGGGLDLITACDMRYCTQDAFFTLFETNLALTADVGTFPRLVKLIPEGFAKEMAFTGRKVSAEEAKSFGLVNHIYDTQAQMLEHVLATAQEIASKAPMAVHGCKRVINYSRDHSTSDTLDYVALWNAGHFKIEEIQEAMKAQQEKRQAQFVDLPKKA